MSKVWIVMFNDRRTGDFGVNRVFGDREDSLRYVIPKMAEQLQEEVGNLDAVNCVELETLYSRLNDALAEKDTDSPYGIEQYWVVEKVVE